MTIPADRSTVTAVLFDNMNGWMPGFFTAIAAVSRAVADGRISDDLIRDYPTDHSYPYAASERLAHLADFGSWSGSEEDIGVAVEAIVALTRGDLGIQEGTWYFEDHDAFAEHGTTLEAVQAALRGCTIRDAATLISSALRR